MAPLPLLETVKCNRIRLFNVRVCITFPRYIFVHLICGSVCLKVPEMTIKQVVAISLGYGYTMETTNDGSVLSPEDDISDNTSFVFAKQTDRKSNNNYVNAN